MNQGPASSVGGLHPAVVRAYDVRGRVGETLFPQDAYFLGRAFGLWACTHAVGMHLPIPTVCVAYDGRLSSTAFSDQLIQGLSHGGCQILFVGLGPTPLLYKSVKQTQAFGGIMITASHNPPEDNGFKLCLHDRPFFGDDLRHLNALIAQNRAVWVREYETKKNMDRTLTDKHQESHAMYGAFLKQACRLRPLKVAWDPGHGAAGPVLSALFPNIPGIHIGLHMEVDGRFPAHPPDPTHPHHLETLRRTVLEQKCDVGIGLDGDGDRMGVIDASGHFVSADVLMQLFSAQVLEHHPGASIIVDIKTSDSVVHTILQHGGLPVTCRTGHSFIKEKIKETGALCAGELSGHFFFADRYDGFDDGLYAALRLIEILSAQTPDVLIQTRMRQEHLYHTQELQFQVQEGQQFQNVDTLKRLLEQDQQPYDAMDGVKVRNPSGWWLLRASNTENKLVGRCEATSAQALQTVLHDLHQYWERVQHV